MRGGTKFAGRKNDATQSGVGTGATAKGDRVPVFGGAGKMATWAKRVGWGWEGKYSKAS